MDVRVSIVRARNLQAKDLGGTSDPFVRVELTNVTAKTAHSRQRQATPVVLKTLNPSWQYDMDFSVSEADVEQAQLHLCVWDYDLLTLPVKSLGSFSAAKEEWRTLCDKLDKPNAKNGEILIRVGTIEVRDRIHIMAEESSIDEAPSTDLVRLSPEQLRSVYGVLELNVVRCSNLPAGGTGIRFDCDPFVISTFSTRTHRTRVITHSRNPVFNEQLLLPVLESERQYPIRLCVYDFDRVTGNDLLGYVEIKASSLFETKDTETNYELILAKERTDKAFIVLRTTFYPYEEIKARFWRQLAEQFDSNSNQTINLSEFSALLDELGCTASDEQSEAFFNRALRSGETELSFEDLGSALDAILASNEVRLITLERNPLTGKALPTNEVEALRDLAVSAVLKPELVDQIVVGGLITEAYASKGWLSKAVNYVTRGAFDASKGNANILVRDRRSGQVHEEEMPGFVRLGIRLLYQTRSRKQLDQKAIRDIFISQSVKQGRKFDNPASAKSIPAFIKFHKLNTEEILDPLDSFKTFNEFFYRKLKPGARVLASADPSVVVSAADARTMVFPTIADATRLWIKGSEFSLQTLFDNAEMAQRYDNGSLCIFRLAPQDYHRFHSPVDGVLGPLRPAGSHLFTVNPMAVRGEVNVYSENKRLVTEINTVKFGKVALIIIGAMMVGSINITAKVGEHISRLDELGYFAFGGSTVIMVLAKDTVVFDADLLANSERQIETLVRVGDSIATAIK